MKNIISENDGMLCTFDEIEAADLFEASINGFVDPQKIYDRLIYW